MTEIYVPRERIDRDEVLVRFDLGGPVLSVDRDGARPWTGPTFAADLVYTPHHAQDVEEAHERELDEQEDAHTNAIEEAEQVSEEKGREAGLDEAKAKLLDVIDKVVALPEIKALFVDGLGARELLADELSIRLGEAL